MRPTHIGFAIPISWKGEYRINGMAADPTAMYLPGCGQHCHIVGMDRATFGVALRRDRFIETLAALRGIGPEDVALEGEPHVLPPSAADRLRRRLVGILRDEIESLTHNGLERRTSEFADGVFGLITEAHLLARPATPPGRRSPSKPGRIVCKAEECFAAAEGGKVSLADLCAATDVSQSALYAAFQTVCDLPPLAYFRRRRLTRARSLFLQSSPRLGAVKYAALESGFTELGRFSVEYRRLFGESPSVTLTRQAF